mgnify:CR=1 FL=1
MNSDLKNILNNWAKEPRESAERLIEEYGEPAEFSATGLLWYDTKDGWKRTQLMKEPVEHMFPDKHNDFLRQFINYKVPPEKFSELAQYDGSVTCDRTRGEMAATCGGTSMNFVAINLAHDIITGKRNVREARDEYSRIYKAYNEGEHPPYTTGFQFELPKGDTSDPDVKTLGASA